VWALSQLKIPLRAVSNQWRQTGRSGAVGSNALVLLLLIGKDGSVCLQDPAATIHQMIYDCIWSSGGMIMTGKTEALGEKPVPGPSPSRWTALGANPGPWVSKLCHGHMTHKTITSTGSQKPTVHLIFLTLLAELWRLSCLDLTSNKSMLYFCSWMRTLVLKTAVKKLSSVYWCTSSNVCVYSFNILQSINSSPFVYDHSSFLCVGCISDYHFVLVLLCPLVLTWN
jgi:hypothetical protein